MITVAQYFMGRDASHSTELTPEIRRNAALTVQVVNELLSRAAAEGVQPGINPQTNSNVSSGWRPPGINEKTANAAKGSTHLQALACDVRDTRGRELARWCLANLDVLAELGLWMEDPRWTPTWVHLQAVPPGSGKRVYRPSSKPPLTPPLPGQS